MPTEVRMEAANKVFRVVGVTSENELKSVQRSVSLTAALCRGGTMRWNAQISISMRTVSS